jgi:hypothetical protein
VFATDSQTWKLVGEDGEEIDDAWKARRRARLMAIYEETMPTVVMIEMFPFGRRRFHFELEPLLIGCYVDAVGGAVGEAVGEARRRPAILCSVRDVLVTGKTAHHAWAAEKIWTYFDKVLVHGDEEVLDFGRTFECLDDIREFVVHTGTDWLGLTVKESVLLRVFGGGGYMCVYVCSFVVAFGGNGEARERDTHVDGTMRIAQRKYDWYIGACKGCLWQIRFDSCVAMLYT